jgi:bla regulator protein blaR1
VSLLLRLAAEHVWESTAFACAAGLLTLTLKSNRARTRYWLWFAASMKFLVPFALLAGAASHIQWRTEHTALPAFGVEQIRQTQNTPVVIAAEHAVEADGAKMRELKSLAPAVLISAWFCGFAAVLVLYGRRWRRVQASVSAGALLEPAVFGILKPVLMLPEGIANRLTSEQLKAIFDHELCHVECRDNLTALLHMLVEAIFWFHPLVWWVGARLVDERERACDEAVLQAGHAPEVYAEGILEVCKLYLASPITCAAGVSGANLGRRIETILTAKSSHPLTLGRKLLLTAAGILAVATPVVVGLANAPLKAEQQQTYKNVLITRGKNTVSGRPVVGSSARQFVMNTALFDLIGSVYHLQAFQVSGGPAWIHSARFAITANTEGIPTLERMRPLKTILEERFHLKFHWETKELPVYLLTVAESGLKLQRSKETASSGKSGVNIFLNHTMDATGFGIAEMPGRRPGLTNILTDELVRMGINEVVLDRTGLTGLFDFHLEWSLAPSSDPDRPSIFSAVRRQLGLKLESGRGPVEILVIDHADDPTAKPSA